MMNSLFTSYYTDCDEEIKKNDSVLSKIRYIVIDVDGTMTDGSIYYDENGNELKKFSTKDAAGFFTAKICGIKTIVITGRKCQATERRMKELQTDIVMQQITDKVSCLKRIMSEENIISNEIAYIGDDINDFAGMQLAGYKACPLDAVDEIKEICDYVSSKNGGDGAVRDVISHILKERGQWEMAIDKCYRMSGV